MRCSSPSSGQPRAPPDADDRGTASGWSGGRAAGAAALRAPVPRLEGETGRALGRRAPRVPPLVVLFDLAPIAGASEGLYAAAAEPWQGGWRY